MLMIIFVLLWRIIYDHILVLCISKCTIFISFLSPPSQTGLPIKDVAHSSQIYKANKQSHFKKLKSEFPEIDYESMLFFGKQQFMNDDPFSKFIKYIVFVIYSQWYGAIFLYTYKFY